MSHKTFMKSILYLLFILSFLSCQQTKSPQENNDSQKEEIVSNKTLTIQVDGMTCTGCEATVENKIKGLPGVSNVKADHKKSFTKIEFDSSKVDKPTFVEAINSTGYKVVEDKQNHDK